jgi:hypothetical protein
MMRSTRLASLTVIAMLAACSSSDDGRVDAGVFTAAARTPGPAQVFLAAEQHDGQTVTLSVRVRELGGIAAADLTLEYDAVRVVFFAWEPGVLLGVGPEATYDVFEEIPGRLRVQISRSPGTVSAGTDDPALVVLRFKVVVLGDTPATFDTVSSAMLDESSSRLPGVSLFGGTFTGL